MSTEEKSLHFIEQIIEENLASGFPQDKLRFRFPPEPNGYLHIGHAKSICLNFGLGLKYNAPVNLRFDDTNPAKKSRNMLTHKEDLVWLDLIGPKKDILLITFNNCMIGLLR
jgi:glutaminyl-tRNA synthetase